MGSDDGVASWATSGAMALTGRADGPALGPPERLVPGVAAIAGRLGLATGTALALLGERAALVGLARGGTTSCGGAARLLPTADGWLALSLARDDDIDLVPVWLGVVPEPGEGPWEAVAELVSLIPTAHLLAAAEGLGLPVAGLGEIGPVPPAVDELPVGWASVVGEAAPRRPLEGVRVVELASLWAGPLCGSLLADLGADVVKVESTGRPDGSRSGPPAVFDQLNAGKRSVVLDLDRDGGRAALAELVRSADVVLEGSRPRALRGLGVVAEDVVAAGPQVWASITAHGRDGTSGLRVGFGDDAAVGGGLVAWEDGLPRFCADAVADPLTGLVAAAGVVEALDRGGRWLLDVAMARVGAALAGPTLAVPPGTEVAAPHARPARGPGPGLGADTSTVLGGLR